VPGSSHTSRRIRGTLTLALILLAGSACAADPAVIDPAERESDRQQASESRQERDGELDREFEREREAEQDSGDRGEERHGGDVERDLEPDQVLALDLSRASWQRARALGFRILDDAPLRDLGFRVTQLSTPGGIPIAAALRRLREMDPSGVYDFNPRYGMAAGRPCEGVRCDGQKLVAWPVEGCPQPVRVGMVDTAVVDSSPALAGSRIRREHFGVGRPPPQNADHGTAVATVLAGQSDAGFAGLIPKATVFAADVFNYSVHAGASTNALLIARGLDWLLAQHVAVINVSIAGPDNVVLHEAVRRVTARGIAVVAAAGNYGPEAPPRYPAAYPESIAVTAVDLLGQAYENANRGDYVDVAAPGVHIWSAGADGQGRFFDGTSFAAPFVTAEVALLQLAQPGLRPPDLKLAVRQQRASGAARPGLAPTAAVLRSQGCAAPTSSTGPSAELLQ
jgi:hypothetical protein